MTIIGISLPFFFLLFQPEEKSFPKEVVIAGKTYSLEIADTPEKQRKGLGGRDGLCQTCAMLFVFPDKGEHSFWMKDMRFPLDIVWFTGDKMVHIEKNIPPVSREIFTPPLPTDNVLEFNAGEAEGFEAGDDVQFLYE